MKFKKIKNVSGEKNYHDLFLFVVNEALLN